MINCPDDISSKNGLNPTSNLYLKKRKLPTDPRPDRVIVMSSPTQPAPTSHISVSSGAGSTQACYPPARISLVRGQSYWPSIEGYEIVEQLGQGGMGVVYQAYQTGLKRLVAIKMIRPQELEDPEHLVRFQIEAEAIAKLNHPHIVEIYAQGTLEKLGEMPTPYFVLEYISGGDLYHFWNRNPQPAIESAILIEKLARAMECAHEKGILHRDLKPANVLLTPEGEPRITDFGLARFFDRQSGLPDASSPTRQGMVVGTPEYMAPEQAMGSFTLTPAVDVYALGVMLYEAITGRCPFEGMTDLDTLEQARDQDPIPPRRLRPYLPVDLETICLKCLEKDPARRYEKAIDLADDLKRFLENRPVMARRANPIERAVRWCRRKPAIAALLACIMGVILSAFFLVSWSYLQAEDARQSAEKNRAMERWERYRSHIVAASSALELNNISTAKRFLQAAPAEHRGWEWHHFTSQLDDSQSVIDVGVPLGNAPTFAISPLSDEVVIGTFTGEIQWIDLATGKLLASRKEHTEPIYTLAFSPDGKWLASGSREGQVRIWNSQERESFQVAQPFTKAVEGLTFDSKSKRLLATAMSEGFKIWEVESKKLLRAVPQAGGRIIITPDFSRVVFCNGHTWFSQNLDSPARTKVVFNKHTADPHRCCIDPTITYAASASLYPECAIRIWNLANGKEHVVLRGHRNSVQWVLFSPSGKEIVSSSADQTIRIWNVETGDQRALLSGHTGSLHEIAFSPNGNYLASASDDGTARIWDSQTGTCLGVLHGHTGPIYNLRFSADGNRLITRSVDFTLRIWEVRECEAIAFRKHTSYVYDVAFSPNGKQIASAAWDGKVILWNAKERSTERELVHRFPIVSSVSYRHDGKRLVTLSRHHQALKGRDVTLWDPTNGKKVWSVHLPVSRYKDARAVFHPTENRLAVGTVYGKVLIMDGRNGKKIAMLSGHKQPILDVGFHPNGNHLVSTDSGGLVKIWDLQAHQEVTNLLEHKADVWYALYSPNGKILATASADGTVKLWETQSYKKVADLPHGSIIYGLAFHPNSRFLACGCADNRIRLWNLEKGQEVGELRGHRDYVHALSFSPDGAQLLSGSGDQMIRIWHTIAPRERRSR